MRGLLWHFVHLLVSIVHAACQLIHGLTFYLISRGVLKRYHIPILNKLKYLAVVVDSEEARDVEKIRELLNWLSGFGINHVILYDMEGVLKKSEINLKRMTRRNQLQCSEHDGAQASIESFPNLLPDKMSAEVLSLSDGKEAIVKSANLLYSEFYSKQGDIRLGQTERAFNELDVGNAMRTVGYGGPEPDLMLVIGSARCHFGFPAWRMRYTEIVHIGQLKSMKHGVVAKAIYDFSVKNQNYGS